MSTTNKFLNANRGGTVDIAAITAEVSRKVEATNAIALDGKANKLQSATGNVLLESTANGEYKESNKDILTRDQTDTIITAAKIEMTSKIAESETRQETRTYSKSDVDNKLRGKLDVIGGSKEGGLIPMQSDKDDNLVLSQYRFSDLLGKNAISSYTRSGNVLVSGISDEQILESDVSIENLRKPIYYKYTKYSSRANADSLFRNISDLFYVSPTDTMTIKYITFNSNDRLVYYKLRAADGVIDQTFIANKVSILTGSSIVAQSLDVPDKNSFVWETSLTLNKEQTWNIRIPNIADDVLVEIWYTL